MLNTSVLDNTTTITDNFEAVNTASNNLFATGILLTGWFILTTSMRARGSSWADTQIVTGIAGIILTTLFIAADWVAPELLILPVIMLFAGIILNKLEL